MRIVVHDYGGYGFSAQLARALAQRSHEVLYLHAHGMNTPRGRVERATDDPPGVSFRAIPLGSGYRRGAGVRRMVHERRYGAKLAAEITKARPDVVISANCPLDAQAAALGAAHGTAARFVHWCQDIYSLAVRRLLERRLALVGSLIGARFAGLERRICREADAVVLIADEFLGPIRGWRGSSDGLAVIENWAPLDEVEPMPKVNPWSQRQGVADKPTFLYAGTLGRKHDPTLLATLAEAVPDAQVIVASEGAGTDRLKADRSLPANLRLLPLQPTAELSPMLASGDVLVALLEEDAQEFSVPSKVLTYLAAGRPILAAIPAVNRAARTIVDAGAGLVVEPRDRAAFSEAGRRLRDDEGLRRSAGESARRYAEQSFDIETIADRFEAVLAERSDRSHASAHGQGRY